MITKALVQSKLISKLNISKRKRPKCLVCHGATNNLLKIYKSEHHKCQREQVWTCCKNSKCLVCNGQTTMFAIGTAALQ